MPLRREQAFGSIAPNTQLTVRSTKYVRFAGIRCRTAGYPAYFVLLYKKRSASYALRLDPPDGDLAPKRRPVPLAHIYLQSLAMIDVNAPAGRRSLAAGLVAPATSISQHPLCSFAASPDITLLPGRYE